MAERAAGHKVDPDGGQRLRFGDVEVVVRASADTSGGAFTIIEETSPVDTPRHVHENEDEIFYVLEGDYVIQSATRSSTSVRVGWPLDRAASPMRSAASCRGPGAS